MYQTSDTTRSNASSATGAPSAAQPGRLYPASIAFLIEERSLLWFENPDDYDGCLHEIFRELSPSGAIECILVKNLVDYIWELRRMKRLKHTVINYVMPDAAVDVLTPDTKSDYRQQARLRGQAADVAFGAEEEVAEGEQNIVDRMHEMRVTPEMLHYRTLHKVADRLHSITQECERLENRFHCLLKNFEMRRATLAAMAKSLVDREKAEVIDFSEGK